MFALGKYSYLEDINLGLAKYTPINKKILDVACGYETLGELYKEKGNTVYGIDIAPDVKKYLKKRLDVFYQADITNFKKVEKLLKNKKFDVIVFADVLEHLYDPIATVKFYKNYLAPKGHIYISVPNFAVWYNRMHVAFGNYQYEQTGTRDKTHIRFFTKNNILQFTKGSGIRIETLDITPGIARFFVGIMRKRLKNKTNTRSLLDSPFYKFYTRFIYPLEYSICKLFSGLLAYQYILITKPISSR